MSWEKEVKSSQSGHHEGSILCSAVNVRMDETGVGVEAAKTREGEGINHSMVRDRLEAGCYEAVRDYLQRLECLRSGNELWSLTTMQYNDWRESF